MKILFTVIFINLTSVLSAKDVLKFEHIDLPPEIINTKILCILEDKTGLMWFGTSSGLICYDGYKVKSIENVNVEAQRSSFGYVSALVEDRANQIWVGTNTGVFIYNKNTQLAKLISDKHLRNKVCRTLYLTSSDEIVIGTEEGLFIYDQRGEMKERYIHQPGLRTGLSNNVVRCIYEDLQKRLWIGTYDQLNLLDRKQKQIKHYRLQRADSLKHRNNLILSIQSSQGDADSILVVGTETGLCLFNTINNVFKQYRHQEERNSISNSVVKSVCVQSTKLWLGTDMGLSIFDIEKNRFENYFYDHRNLFSPSSNVINHVYIDKLNNVWLATDIGIDKAYINGQVIVNNIELIRGVLKVNSVSKNNNDDIWIASDEGVIHYKNHEEKYKQYLPPLLLHNKVNEVYCDSNGNVWIATSGGLNFYDNLKGEFSAYVANNNGRRSLETNYISCIEEDNEGALWVGTYNKGIYKAFWNQHNQLEFVNYKHQSNNENSLISNKVFDIEIDEDNVWVATNKGVNRLNVVSGIFERYSHLSGGNTNHFISQFFIDKDSSLWMATGKGLYHLEAGGTQFNWLRDLPKSVSSVAALDSVVYFVARNSFHLYDLKNEELIRIPNVKLGLTSITDLKLLDDGRMVLSGNKGFVTVHVKALKIDKRIPKVHWTSFSIHNDEVRPFLLNNDRNVIESQIDETEYIELDYLQNSFTMEFSSFQYSFENSCAYKYLLEGFDKEWQTTRGNQNYAAYTQVRPGTYKLMVKASNTYGLFGDEVRTMVIKVNPPFYFSTWAIVLYICLIITLFFVSRRMLIAREKHLSDIRFQTLQRQKSEELIEIKTRFFTNISHELKTPLTLISSPIDDLLTKNIDESVRKPLKLVKRNTDRLKKLVSQILDIRNIDSGGEILNVQEYNIIWFIDNVVSQFKSEAERRDMLLQYVSHEESLLMHFDMEKTEKILVNLLSNALKFTPDGGVIKVQLQDGRQVNKKQNELLVSIIDNGGGIRKEDQGNIFNRFYTLGADNYSSQQGTGIGLSMVKEYVTLQGGKIFLESELGKGSCFTFSIPFNLQKDNQVIKRKAQFAKVEIDIESELGREKPFEGEPDTKRLKILIVEDDKDLGEYLADGLHEKYEVLVAENGQEGFRLALAEVPDLIISDWMMPVMNGIQLCQNIKDDLRTCHIPFILLTAKGGLESQTEGIETGADDYMQKPFNMAYLLIRIQNLIDQRTQLKVIYAKQIKLEPSKITVTTLDEKFLDDLKAHMEKEIDNPELNVAILADKMGMKTTNLYRKIKALTGQSATEFIRTFRLKRAAQLLKEEGLNVTDVMYMAGFNHRSYFTRSFKALYGVSPKEYKNEKTPDASIRSYN
ncbi:hybrid sensor histidine kinase/response regulator transcription factor [Carboxylicivirga taeanensis]|uniref:hybrid sensor histidine kinase/response regulator transcription factor n=1 Tax=Carboxylicivirga taeanensis TaxID=1416875 RepID=UPI003F6DAE02